jgi:hypothetical protein
MPYRCKMQKANANVQYIIVPTTFYRWLSTVQRAATFFAMQHRCRPLHGEQFGIKQSTLRSMVTGYPVQSISCLSAKLSIKAHLRTLPEPGASNLFWQTDTSVIVYWFGAARRKITIIDIPNCLNCCEIFEVYAFYKCGHWPHNITWRASCGPLATG